MIPAAHHRRIARLPGHRRPSAAPPARRRRRLARPHARRRRPATECGSTEPPPARRRRGGSRALAHPTAAIAVSTAGGDQHLAGRWGCRRRRAATSTDARLTPRSSNAGVAAVAPKLPHRERPVQARVRGEFVEHQAQRHSTRSAASRPSRRRRSQISTDRHGVITSRASIAAKTSRDPGVRLAAFWRQRYPAVILGYPADGRLVTGRTDGPSSTPDCNSPISAGRYSPGRFWILTKRNATSIRSRHRPPHAGVTSVNSSRGPSGGTCTPTSRHPSRTRRRGHRRGRAGTSRRSANFGARRGSPRRAHRRPCPRRLAHRPGGQRQATILRTPLVCCRRQQPGTATASATAATSRIPRSWTFAARGQFSVRQTEAGDAGQRRQLCRGDHRQAAGSTPAPRQRPGAAAALHRGGRVRITGPGTVHRTGEWVAASPPAQVPSGRIGSGRFRLRIIDV